jgi:peptidoglycan/LPS O-acetylase OafA/YrhL
VALFPSAAALTLLMPALAITLAAAALSWHLVEKPSLALKARMLGARRRKATGRVLSEPGLQSGQ